MKANKSVTPGNLRIMWLAVGLAGITSISYVLIALDVLAVGDLQVAMDEGIIIFVAAGCYLLGGLLILSRRRWLWISGAVINALVILFFINLYKGEARSNVFPGRGGYKSCAVNA